MLDQCDFNVSHPYLDCGQGCYEGYAALQQTLHMNSSGSSSARRLFLSETQPDLVKDLEKAFTESPRNHRLSVGNYRLSYVSAHSK